MSITRPIAGRITQPTPRALNAPGVGGGGGGDPLLDAALALNPVFLHDFKDPTSFFLDAAMTTPATVNGLVGAIADKSGNARHFTQSTTARKTILRQSGSLYYLEFDGVDDDAQSAAVNLGATDAMTMCFGARKLSDAAVGAFFSFGNVDTLNGSTAFRLPGSVAPTFMVLSRGTTARFALYNNAAIAAPITKVWTGTCDISLDSVIARVNGTQVATATTDQGTGNYGNHPFYFGRNSTGGQPFSGYYFGGAVYASVLSGTDLAAVEAFVADRTGVTL